MILRGKKFVQISNFLFFILCLIKIHSISNFVPDKKIYGIRNKRIYEKFRGKKKYFIFIFSLYVFIFNYSIFRFLYLREQEIE